MKNILIFIGGFIAGMLCLYIFSVRSEQSEQDLLKERVMLEVTNILDKKVEIQYVEIKGKKGTVTIHTGMPKDSVQMLVGKPDEINLFESGNTSYEEWGYKLGNKYGTDLDIKFKDGKLEGVRQN